MNCTFARVADPNTGMGRSRKSVVNGADTSTIGGMGCVVCAAEKYSGESCTTGCEECGGLPGDGATKVDL